MAPPSNLAKVEDVEARLGAPVGNERQVEARIGDASARVRAYGGPVARGWAIDTVPDDVRGVVASMVERASLNPGGVVQEQAGPFGRSFGADAARRLYLTADEKAIVRGACGRSALTVLATGRGVPDSAMETPTVIIRDEGLVGDAVADDPFTVAP